MVTPKNSKSKEPQESGGKVKRNDRNDRGRFIKGHKKLGGIKVGTTHFKTDFENAIKKIARINNTSLDEIKLDLIRKGVIEARKGKFPFYKDVLDRYYGKPPESLDLSSGGEPISISFDNTFKKEKPKK